MDLASTPRASQRGGETRPRVERDRVRGTWLPHPAPASVAGKRGFGWEVTGSEGPGSDAPASVAGKRGFGWEVTGSEGPGSHATHQPAAENRGKSSPPPTESKIKGGAISLFHSQVPDGKLERLGHVGDFTDPEVEVAVHAA